MSPNKKLVLILALFSTAAAAKPGDEAATIKRLSQEFSDASATGDGKALAPYLDERVIFMNETGEIATRKDLVESSNPRPPGVTQTLEQGDFKVELHGDTAVTSFTDHSTMHVRDQVMKADYLSTEVWQKKGGRWLMISSQTMTKAKEPVAITLAPALLDEYAGTYSANGTTVKIERKDAALTSATNGGAPAELDVEARDIAFTPGQPRLRRVFVREGGKVTGFMSIREAGDIFFKRAG